MPGVLRGALAASAAVAALMMAPAGASAKPSCIFDDLDGLTGSAARRIL